MSSHSQDAIRLLDNSITLLTRQLAQARDDIAQLELLKADALLDPRRFLHQLASGSTFFNNEQRMAADLAALVALSQSPSAPATATASAAPKDPVPLESLASTPLSSAPTSPQLESTSPPPPPPPTTTTTVIPSGKYAGLTKAEKNAIRAEKERERRRRKKEQLGIGSSLGATLGSRNTRVSGVHYLRAPTVLMNSSSSSSSTNNVAETVQYAYRYQSERDLVNVEFEFYPFVESDYHGVKTMLAAGFAADADRVDLVALTELILSQTESAEDSEAACIGTTVKVDGVEGDPFAFVSCIGLSGPHWKDNPVSKNLESYLLAKCPTSDNRLQPLLDNGKLAFLFNERFINMPWQVAVPMLDCLLNELKDAGDKYAFEHLLLLSPTYRESDLPPASDNDDNNDDSVTAGKKRKNKARAASGNKKQKGKKAASPVSYLHLEDEYIAKHAEFTFDISIATAEKSKDDEFGLTQSRRVIVVPVRKMAQVVKELQQMVQSSDNLISQGAD
ncbi:Mss4p nuclear export [Sorochytrium milnesiophthora]